MEVLVGSSPTASATWGIATPHGEDTSGDGDDFLKEPKGCKTPMPLLMIFLAALHRLTSKQGNVRATVRAFFYFTSARIYGIKK